PRTDQKYQSAAQIRQDASSLSSPERADRKLSCSAASRSSQAAWSAPLSSGSAASASERKYSRWRRRITAVSPLSSRRSAAYSRIVSSIRKRIASSPSSVPTSEHSRSWARSSNVSVWVYGCVGVWVSESASPHPYTHTPIHPHTFAAAST